MLQVVRELQIPPYWDTKRDEDHVGLLTTETVEVGAAAGADVSCAVKSPAFVKFAYAA